MLVSLEDMKNYLGINTSPQILNFSINATLSTLTRAAGDWTSAGIVVGTKLLLGGFTNPTNNIVVTITGTSALTLNYTPVVGMITEAGNPLSTYRIENLTYDSFLTEQEEIISDSIELYCNRKFMSEEYVQTFYKDECLDKRDSILLFHFPVSDLAYAKDGGVDVTDDVRLNSEIGNLKFPGSLFSNGDEIEVRYTAGYATLPTPIKSVVYSLVSERYNKKVAGVDLNFGSDIQRVSIPGTISIDFDYTLQSNERKTAFGTILGNYVNVLDRFRSDRIIDPAISYVVLAV